MTRRSLFRLLGSAVVGMALSRTLPGVVPEAAVLPAPTEAVLFQKGDIITIEGYNVMQPYTGEAIPGMLQQFMVTEDVGQ